MQLLASIFDVGRVPEDGQVMVRVEMRFMFRVVEHVGAARVDDRLAQPLSISSFPMCPAIAM